MKKLIAMALILSFLCLLGSCGNKEGDYKLSVGTVLSEDIEGLGVTGTSAALVTDREGKVILCRLDCADMKATVTDGRVTGSAVEKTKYELGESYGMKEGGGAIAEWYQQATYFESFIKGKTIVEIEGIKTKDTELSSGCTIDVTDFVRAVSAAIRSDKKVSFSADGELSAGVSIICSSTEKNGNAEFLYDTAAAVISGGKIAAAFIDSAEATVTVKDGKGAEFIYSGTKNELGSDYGMVEKGGAIAEWYEQAANYAKSAVGKSTDSLSGLPTENVSGCTINADPLKAALVRAAKNVR